MHSQHFDVPDDFIEYFDVLFIEDISSIGVFGVSNVWFMRMIFHWHNVLEILPQVTYIDGWWDALQGCDVLEYDKDEYNGE